MRIIRRFLKNIRGMSNEAYIILKSGVIVSCLMLFAALAVIISAEDSGAVSVSLYRFASELYTAPSVVLLIAVICSAIIEERSRSN